MKKLEQTVQETPIDISLKILAREINSLKQTPTLKYMKMYPDVQDPIFANPGDMCFDIFAYSEPNITKHYVEYKTGLRFEIPEGCDMLFFPRSSISKYDLVLANSVGVIDQGYRGEVLVRFKMIKDLRTSPIYEKGDKICQGVLIPKMRFNLENVLVVSTDTKRGEGGFGSSGT